MFKNSYNNIALPEEAFERMRTTQKLLFFFLIFSGLLYTALSYGVVLTAEVNIHFPIIYVLHEFWLYIFPVGLIFLLLNWQHLFYRSKFFRLLGTIIFSIFLLSILLMMLSMVFITEPSSLLVNSIYLSHLALFLFYFTKYLRLWNGVFSGEEGKKYALRIEQYEWREDVVNMNGVKEKNNYPFYTKAFERIGNVVVASGFILPTIFAMSATGTNVSIPVIVVELFVFLIAPFAYYVIAKGVAWYLFIRRLEKEKNVIIYNGVWLT